MYDSQVRSVSAGNKHSLAIAWDAKHGSGHAHVADVFALTAPRLNEVLRGVTNERDQLTIKLQRYT